MNRISKGIACIGVFATTLFAAQPGLNEPAATGRVFGNSFGMQLRPAPKSARDVFAPAIVRAAPSNECSIIARQDGALEIYFITKPESESVSWIRSDDGGLTWSEPQVAFKLPGRGYYAVQAVAAREGALHVVAHVFKEGPGGYRGRLYEVYHAAKLMSGREEWSEPKRIVAGYVGSIRGFIETRRGRLLLSVGRAIPAREQKPAAGADYGWNDTFVFYSDDQGASWHQSEDVLTLRLESENVTRHGAIEPVMLELNDGRIWMLVRDRQGRLWQSFSRDGSRWAALERSSFISSDSPAELERLSDGRIVLFTNGCQFWTNPRSYAMGGREVLHGAITRDDGQTWRGFREVLHETNMPVKRGDRGAAYPSAAETRDGKVVLVSGQGEGRHAIVLLDPAWLEERDVRDDVAIGPVGWAQYGANGLKVVEAGAQGRAVAIPLRTSGLCGASWNFPVAAAGELRLRVQVPGAVSALRLILNDHFTRVDDVEAGSHSVFKFDLNFGQRTRAPDEWREVRIRWRDAQRGGSATLEIDGQPAGAIEAQRPAQWGVHTLRVEFQAMADSGELRLAGVQATVTTPGTKPQ
jgi:hypothetical protein